MTNAVAMTFAVLVDWSYAGSGAPNFASTNADVTAYVKDISITSGIQDAMSSTAYVGTCSLTLDNSSRRFSPAYTSGPLYGNLVPNKPIKVTITDGVTTWTLFRGWLTDVNPSSGQYGDRECMIEAMDVLGKIQKELVGMPLFVNVRSSELLRCVINYALKAAVATAVITLTAVPSAGNTLVLNDGSGAVTLTWVSTLTGAADQVKIGADLTECTQNLAAAVNKGTGAATTYAGNITLPRTITAQPVTATQYEDSNYDTPVPLQTSAMSGETVTVGSGTLYGVILGSYGNSNYRAAQSITPAQSGLLTNLGFRLGNTYGTPGPITLTVRKDSITGTLLYTGVVSSPTANAWNDHAVTAPVYLTAGTLYFVKWTVPHLAGDNNYGLLDEYPSSYAGGYEYLSDDDINWVMSEQSGQTMDIDLRYTTIAVVNREKLAQSFQLPTLQSFSALTLYLAKVGVPTGTLTLRIETDSGGSPSGVLADVNATTTLAESSLTTSLADVVFTFANAPVLNASTSYWLVLSTDRSPSVANFVVWGADASSPGYTSGEMKSYDGAAWNAESKDACFSTGAYTATLSAVLHGAVGNNYTISKTGSWCTLSGSTFAGGVDEPADLAPSIETGLNLFQYAGDGWSAEGENATNAMTCIEQIGQSETLSMFWIARDGRITWKNRAWFPTQAQTAADLSLSSQHNAVEGGTKLDTLFNWVGATYAPVGTLATGVVAKSTSTIVVPGLTGLLERWNPTQVITTQSGTKVVKLPYTDPATGQNIAALSVITPLVPSTDYVAWEFSDKTGWEYTSSPSLHFSVVVLGTGVEITVTNSAIGPLYIFDLQTRGVGLTHYQTTQAVAEDTVSQAKHGRLAYSFDLPLVSNDNAFADQLVRYFLERFSSEDYHLTAITFVNQNMVGSTNLFSLDYGDILSVTDAQTGLTTAKYVITGASYQGIGPGRTGSLTFYVRWVDPTARIVQGNAYAYPNCDSAFSLYKDFPSTSTITATGSDFSVGNVAGVDYQWAQSFQIAAGSLRTFTFKTGANSGSPSGSMTWKICADNSGVPGTVLATGTLTPTASATNTVNIPLADQPYLAASTAYWLVLKSTAAQSTNVYWVLQAGADSYALGIASYSTDSGAWTSASGYDIQSSFTSTPAYNKLAQPFELTTDTLCSSVRLYLKKVASPTGTLMVRIETDSAGLPSGTLVASTATGTFAEASLSTLDALIPFVLTDSTQLSANTPYWLVLSTDRTLDATNYINMGVDASTPLYTNGDFAARIGPSWFTITGTVAAFEVVPADKIFSESVAG